MKAAAATFSAEFGCPRGCIVELDLDNAHQRYTVTQMRERAEKDHTEAHRHAYKVFRPRLDALVRARELPGGES